MRPLCAFAPVPLFRIRFPAAAKEPDLYGVDKSGGVVNGACGQVAFNRVAAIVCDESDFMQAVECSAKGNGQDSGFDQMQAEG